VIGTTPVPTLVYGRRLHVISLSAVPAAGVTAGSTMRRSINGYNLVGWSENEMLYWAASDLSVGELQTFAELFRTSPADR
jgi:anti-sigma factor RsiW